MSRIGARTVHVAHVMGTVASLDLRGPGDSAAAVAAVVAWLEDVDAAFSTYRPDSEVSRFARGELAEADLSADGRHVLEVCRRVREASGGAFDAERDGGYDPSAYVKGWSGQRAVDLIREHGVADFFLSVGGDVVVRGGAEPGGFWRIGVQHPFDRTATAAVLGARDLAVATSGLYERGGHLVDARTGRAPTGIASVTVCGPDLGLADAYSTAAFALGDAGPGWLAALPGYESFTITADGRTLATPGFPVLVGDVPVVPAPADPLLTSPSRSGSPGGDVSRAG
jgi:thiamine biosynthesis lipoprotein